MERLNFGTFVAAVSATPVWKEQFPAAKIGTNFLKVLVLQPIGRLLNLLDSTWLT